LGRATKTKKKTRRWRTEAEDLPRLGVEIGNIFSNKKRLEDDVLVVNLEGRDLAIGVDVLEVPLRPRDSKVDGDDLVLLLGLGKGENGAGGVGAEIRVVKDELWGSHCWVVGY